MADPSTLKLIKAARLIDGLGERPIENGAVLVEGSRIRWAGITREVAPPAGAIVEEYNYPTGTLLPGLVDAHCHFNYFGDGTHSDDVMSLPDDVLLMRSLVNARVHLESGVTSARENGAKHDTAFSLRDGIRQGLARGPRLVVSGNPVTMTGGHMWQMGSEADGVDGVRVAVRRLVKKGADWIKVAATGGSTRTSLPYRPSYSVEELRTICEEAHNLGKLVGTHCRSTGGIVTSLDAGVDMIIHSWFVEEDGSWNFRRDVAERIAREGTVVNSTIHIRRAPVWMLLEKAERTGESPVITYGNLRLDLETVQRDYENVLEQAARLHELGVPLIPGSDSGFGWYPFGGFGYELECLVLAGVTPMRAIIAATRDASEAIGVSNIVGTLEQGKEADLVVVDGNPAEDIKAIRKVLGLFQGGIQVK